MSFETSNSAKIRDYSIAAFFIVMTFFVLMFIGMFFFGSFLHPVPAAFID